MRRVVAAKGEALALRSGADNQSEGFGGLANAQSEAGYSIVRIVGLTAFGMG